MIKFTNFIKDFTEGKQSKIKFKFHMSTKFLDLNKSPYDCLIEDAEDCQNLNNYRNEKGKSSRLDGGVYKVEIAKPKHYEIGGYNISLLFHR